MSKRRTPSQWQSKQTSSYDATNSLNEELKPRKNLVSEKHAMTERNKALAPPGQSTETGKQAGALQLAICVCGIYASL